MLVFYTCGRAAWQPRRTEPCHCVSGQPWACHGPLQGRMQPLRHAADLVESAVGAAAGGLGRWFMGVIVLLNAGVLHMWTCCLATTAHRALPLCKWPALGMPWATARTNAASAVCSRYGAVCSWCYGQCGQALCAEVGKRHLHICKTPAFIQSPNLQTTCPARLQHLVQAQPARPAACCRGCI